MREDRDRGKLTVADSFAQDAAGLRHRARRPTLVADLVGSDAESPAPAGPRCATTRCRSLPVAQVARHGDRAGVSNCADTTGRCWTTWASIPLVDAVVLSCEVGSMKPYPEIYAPPWRSSGSPRSTRSFIDDQPGVLRRRGGRRRARRSRSPARNWTGRSPGRHSRSSARCWMCPPCCDSGSGTEPAVAGLTP